MIAHRDNFSEAGFAIWPYAIWMPDGHRGRWAPLYRVEGVRLGLAIIQRCDPT